MEDTIMNLEPMMDTVQTSFDSRHLQWVTYDTERFFSEDGKVISTKTTYYDVPDKPLYELFPDIVLGDLAMIEMRNDYVEDDNLERKGEKAPEPDEGKGVLKLSPKGLALVALSVSGLIKSLDDPRFEKFWEYFSNDMKKNGYAVEE